ncbi:MAG: hypothetical protein KF901_08970 [Myxococcales bacterium]|nr:hypothetical protein [Myxococcales bacterium]
MAERVTAGAPLVDLFGPGAAVLDVPAPCDGVVAAIDHGPPLVITLRRIIAGATS